MEALLRLLTSAKRHMAAAQPPGLAAVACGAIASDYQRLRVEEVAGRVGLTVAAPLWHQPQPRLLRWAGGTLGGGCRGAHAW